LARWRPVGWFLLALLSLPLTALARPAHIPTESELARARRQPDPAREYQRDSVASFGQKSQSTAQWVKDKLSGIHVSPARLLIGLGLCGILLTWSKNKRMARWLALTALSYLLALIGAAGLLFRWPYLS